MPQLMKGSRVSRADFTDFQKGQAKAKSKPMHMSMKRQDMLMTKKNGKVTETPLGPPVEIGSAKDEDEEY